MSYVELFCQESYVYLNSLMSNPDIFIQGLKSNRVILRKSLMNSLKRRLEPFGDMPSYVKVLLYSVIEDVIDDNFGEFFV